MTSRDFLSTATVVVILACVALLAVLSAHTLAPLEKRRRRGYGVAFALCMVGIWALAVLAIALIKGTI